MEAPEVYAMKWAAVLILSLQLALFPTLGRILGMGEINGIIAASLWILAKPMLIWTWEQTFAAMLVAVDLWLLASPYSPRGEPGRYNGVALGLSNGAVDLYASDGRNGVRRLASLGDMAPQVAFFKEFFVPLVLLPIAILAPWTVRAIQFSTVFC